MKIKCIILSKEAYVLYDLIFMTTWKGQNYRQKHVSSYEELIIMEGDQKGPTQF